MKRAHARTSWRSKPALLAGRDRPADWLAIRFAIIQYRYSFVYLRVRPRDDVGSDDFTDPGCGCSAGIHGCAHRAHFAADDGDHETGIDLFVAHESNFGGFDHRIRRFDHSDQPSTLNHSQCFFHRTSLLTNSVGAGLVPARPGGEFEFDVGAGL